MKVEVEKLIAFLYLQIHIPIFLLKDIANRNLSLPYICFKIMSMNIRYSVTFLLVVLVAMQSFGQSENFTIANNIVLTKDSTLKSKLLSSFNSFLSQKNKPAKLNTCVLKKDALETSLLIDELRDIEKSSRYRDTTFYKGYLTNLISLDSSNYLLQLAYIGIHDGQPLLRANFTVAAQKTDSGYFFHSPLRENTADWSNQTIGTTRVYFNNCMDKAYVTSYLKMIEKYDRKLNAPVIPTAFYCTANFHEVMQLIGVDYKSDYAGFAHNSVSGRVLDSNIVVNGTLAPNTIKFDPHDLWHDRLHNVLSVAIINRPVDEGSAYLYGGSWGMSWKDILTKFKTFVSNNPSADWLTLYNESKNFADNSKYPLNVDFMINALLIEKIEREKGFSSVIEFLSCGKKEKGNENYFKALERILGYTKETFNVRINALIAASK